VAAAGAHGGCAPTGPRRLPRGEHAERFLVIAFCCASAAALNCNQAAACARRTVGAFRARLRASYSRAAGACSSLARVRRILTGNAARRAVDAGYAGAVRCASVSRAVCLRGEQAAARARTTHVGGRSRRRATCAPDRASARWVRVCCIRAHHHRIALMRSVCAGTARPKRGRPVALPARAAEAYTCRGAQGPVSALALLLLCMRSCVHFTCRAWPCRTHAGSRALERAT
jgi:hypothetical protein